MGDILFNIVVRPIMYVLELSFSLLYGFTKSEGVAIVGISVVVNVLCLPLYRMADEHQERERQRQEAMGPYVAHIRKTFAGDERQMMLSAYYREQGYHPAMALIGSLPLLFQIPFFMAAYTYLSNLTLLDGASFWFMDNLGAPDALLQVGGLTINALPVAMTLLNCASTFIYTRGLPLRDKLQAYGLAALFLVLLYDSPSGLVFYWTCNQVFSLAKNVFLKLVKNPGKKAIILTDVLLVAGAIWVFASGKVKTSLDVLMLGVGVAAVLVLSAYALRPDRMRKPPVVLDATERKRLSLQFFLGALLVTLLAGVLVPIAVIADSPMEFIDTRMFVDPLTYVVHTACVWGGLFVLWLGTFFLLSSDDGRRAIATAVWCLCGLFLVNYFFFKPDFGTLSSTLTFDDTVGFTQQQMIMSIFITVGLCVGLTVLWRRANKIVVPVLAILSVALVTLIVPCIGAVRAGTEEALALAQKDGVEYFDNEGNVMPLISLSRSGRNVVVLFTDRALSGALPFVLAERPELVEKLDGFTYYPNTVSYGQYTNTGVPAIYGGYEYTPAAMNARSYELLEDKHDEALKVMPALFDEAGFATTLVNPPYAGYTWKPDLSVFDDLANTKAYDLKGVYTLLVDEEYGIPAHKAGTNGRTFAFYALFRLVPQFAQEGLYQSGRYRSTSMVMYAPKRFVDQWSVLHLLPELSDVQEEGDTFLALGNATTHESTLLSLPDYEPASSADEVYRGDAKTLEVNGKTMLVDTKNRLGHYQINASALIQLGRWFDWMREQGVYDNTRIIIVSDHGRDLRQFEGQQIDDVLDLEMVNPLLMVKDFGAHGFSTSNEFMTTAETPALALADIVDDPVNPFTGKQIVSDDKSLHEQLVTATSLFDVDTNNGTTFDTSDAPWYAVSGNIFDLGNWRRLSDEETALVESGDYERVVGPARMSGEV